MRPENVSDRFTRTHEKVYLLTKAGNYWFDQDEVREPLVTKPRAATGSTAKALPRRVLRVGDRVRVWTANPLGRNGRDIWEIATTSHKGKHPATFPTELVRRCLKASCPPGGHVLDPFAGSGTTGLASAELGHNATLIELNPEYVSEARCRLRAEALSAAAITKSEPVILNKNTTLYEGDCCELMQAIPDATIELVVIDPPFYLNVPTDRTVINHLNKQNGKKSRFRGRWDQLMIPMSICSSLRICSSRPSACYPRVDQFLCLRSTKTRGSSISCFGALGLMFSIMWYGPSGTRHRCCPRGVFSSRTRP